MHPFTLLVKPASADCNLHCEYCFYLKKHHLYPETKRHRMSDEVLKQLIKSYMATPQPMYSIGWQGGEPTLMGVEFFTTVVEYQQQYGHRGAVVGNGLQTNATLITDEMARLFGEYHFLLGCSLDGPAEIHNRYRRNIDGKPSHADVLRGLETLKRHNVEFNILVLVSQANVDKAREIYRYLVELGYFYHQYIPCVEFTEQGELLPFAITGKEWGEFLCELFDEWYPKDTTAVSIRHFDSILVKLVDGVSNVCVMGDNCCQYLVVEHNGDIYPCDFFVEPSLKIGNIMDTSWEEALNSPIYHQFGAMKAQWNEVCNTCDFLELCGGDCLKHRIYAGNPPQTLGWLCVGWNRFLRYTRKRFEKLADRVRRQRLREQQRYRPPGPQPKPQAASVGRNAPCPCGSGKKYKKCCGA
jgi:uncharacterized protein